MRRMRKPQRQLVSPMNKGILSAAPPKEDDNWVSEGPRHKHPIKTKPILGSNRSFTTNYPYKIILEYSAISVSDCWIWLLGQGI